MPSADAPNPLKVIGGAAAVVCQTRTVLSLPVLASRRPSGL
jgi:hypothetical protein